MSNETTDLLCHDCGHAFSAFLNEMAEQNEKVVCPNCRQNPDCKPAEASTDEPAKDETGKKPN
jgi:hypothetical protein